MKLGIFNEFNGKERSYINACKDLKIDYEVVDIISNNWINNVVKSNCDGYLVRPAGDKMVWKNLYDERLFFIVNKLNKTIYPSLDEILLYENKKVQAYWLKLNNVPHPETNIFYNREEALAFINSNQKWPVLFKPNVGSVGIGIKILKTPKQAKSIIDRIFTRYRFYNRGYMRWHKTKRGIVFPRMDDKQYNYVMFQEFINIKHEWRTLRIGNSYFGHQKLKKGNFHSGSGLVGWVQPPLELMNFAHSINSIDKFRSMNIDVFEDEEGNYLVNELQTLWGGELISQMNIDDKPFRFLYNNGNWDLEEGSFNQNKSCNLRVLDFIEILKK